MDEEFSYLPKSELVSDAKFSGKYDIPVIKNYEGGEVKELIPFNQRKGIKNKKDTFLHFYLYDNIFSEVLENPKKFVEEFKQYGGIISPDRSIYTDFPLCFQIINIYISRMIGYFYQKEGIAVIPNVRWGDSRSYEFCFEGLEKNGIYCISTHGCVKNVAKRILFKEGLEVMLTRLEPKLILVHGTMPDYIFGEYKTKYNFKRYDDFFTKIYKKGV